MTSGPMLAIRSRLDRRTACCFVLACCAELVLYGRTFEVPVVPGDLIAITSPLVPVVPAVVALRPFDTPLAALERATALPRRAALARGWTYGCSLVVLGTSQLLVLLVARTSDGAAAGAALLGGRNAVTFWALGLVSGWLLGVDLSWLAPTLLVTALVFFGRDADRVPHGWALPLHDSASGAAWSMAVVLTVVAGALGLRRDLSLSPATRRMP